MINDNRIFSIDSTFNDIEVDGKFEQITDIVEYIKTYIKQYDIAPTGTTIVMNNARSNCSAPSGYGTMYNLYMLFKYYFINN